MSAVIAFTDVLESAREAGTSHLSAANLASMLGLQQQDLAALAGVHRNTMRTHPESPRLQAALRDLMRVLSATMEVQPDAERAFFLIKNQPIPEFRHKTIWQLIQEGRTEDAISYLESIASGFVG
ncbi:MAG: DNA-binding protein [Alcaligenaceae bacterium]|nr:DNA-binding protein [Alcaligenaceae bacterium]